MHAFYATDLAISLNTIELLMHVYIYMHIHKFMFCHHFSTFLWKQFYSFLFIFFYFVLLFAYGIMTFQMFNRYPEKFPSNVFSSPSYILSEQVTVFCLNLKREISKPVQIEERQRMLAKIFYLYF